MKEYEFLPSSKVSITAYFVVMFLGAYPEGVADRI